MFTKEVVGTANALVGGWGNLGGGVTQLVMGSALFPLFKIFFDGDAEKAWRTVCVVPAVVAFSIGVMIYYISDDAPKGNYGELKKHGQMAEVSAAASFRQGAFNLNTWFLFVQVRNKKTKNMFKYHSDEATEQLNVFIFLLFITVRMLLRCRIDHEQRRCLVLRRPI